MTTADVDWKAESDLNFRLYLESIKRTHDLCDRIMEAAAAGDPLTMLDEVGDFLTNIDAIDDDDESSDLWTRGHRALRQRLGMPKAG